MESTKLVTRMNEREANDELEIKGVSGVSKVKKREKSWECVLYSVALVSYHIFQYYMMFKCKYHACILLLNCKRKGQGQGQEESNERGEWGI